MKFHRFSTQALALTALLMPGVAHAHEASRGFQARAGLSAIWFLANLSYAGMRAQNSANRTWRIVAFIFGFPGTLITFLAVPEGGERAYGIDLPKASKSDQS